ncbi:GntR family transcriptional regulator [Streptosporangium canum]|uniref:GntR family transcriptional regulator n=1 Tax=Streptosporangium canum TaxID=324952 RepID=UPI00367A805A
MAEWSGQFAYKQVADDLRADINRGKYQPGEQLPSYDRLMKDYGVSITVVRSAVRELRVEGYVIPHQGKGVFVCDPLPANRAAEESADFKALMAELRAIRTHLDSLEDRLSTVERLVSPAD